MTGIAWYHIELVVWKLCFFFSWMPFAMKRAHQFIRPELIKIETKNKTEIDSGRLARRNSLSMLYEK